MKTIIEKAKEKFLKMVKDFGSDPYHLLPHVPEVEKWADCMLRRYPEADRGVILLSVWLHDIGHYPPSETDHAVISEEIAKKFLEKQNYPRDKMDKVLHCIRSHRCRDVLPRTFEAKMMAFMDSASHLTTPVYFDMARQDKEKKEPFRAFAKLERDMRDLSYFPKDKQVLKELSNAWERLLKAYEKIEMD